MFPVEQKRFAFVERRHFADLGLYRSVSEIVNLHFCSDVFSATQQLIRYDTVLLFLCFPFQYQITPG